MQKSLEQNIIKYGLYKIFTKRVFLPLIPIFLIDYGHVSLGDLAAIASLTAIARILMEVPTGYVADRWGHKPTLVFGSFLTAISVLPYIFINGFAGGLLASVLFSVGYAFTAGTAQAFMHETLMALNRENEYSRVMGLAQSRGLLGNVLLISLVPLTYKIDPLMPFVLGFVCLAVSCALACSFVKPPVRPIATNRPGLAHLIANLKHFHTGKSTRLQLLLVFILFGFTSAGYDSAITFREVEFKAIGIPVDYFGLILAVSSLLAALVGRYIHVLKRLSAASFYAFDILYLCAAYILIGITKEPIVIAFAFILFPTYSRTRDIIFESHVFEEFPNSNHKATLISVLNFFAQASSVGAPLLLAFLVTQTDLGRGHLFFGLSLLLLTTPIFLGYKFFAKKQRPKQAAELKDTPL